MSIDPESLIKPLGLIEKLIVEHGSSVAQGHFIKLLQAQLSVLKDGIADRENEARLNATKISELLSEVETLKSKLHELKPPDRVSEDTEKILKFFFDAGCGLSNQQICRQFQFNKSTVNFHLDALMDKKLIRIKRPGYNIDGEDIPPAFEIEKNGRSYVVSHLQ
jgi:hypothetical protein